jgi:hypothetical protein
VAKLIPTNAKVRPESGHRTILASGPVIMLKSGKPLTLQIDKNISVLKIEPDQNGNCFLVDHGSKGHAIYNSGGESILTLPTVSQILPELASSGRFQWEWGCDDTLIGVLELYEVQVPNQYPDTDHNPNDVRFFAYSMGSKAIVELKVPSLTKDWLLRLDGVSDEGLLIVSEVQRDLYFDGRQGNFLDAYQLPP